MSIIHLQPTIAEQIQHHMNKICQLFDMPKITLVVRSASLEGDVIFTNDDPENSIAAIHKMCRVHDAPEIIRPN